jgi:hypothetical protein
MPGVNSGRRTRRGMELQQRHREHGVRIWKEEIELEKFFLIPKLRALCDVVVIPFPSVSSLPLLGSSPASKFARGDTIRLSSGLFDFL